MSGTSISKATTSDMMVCDVMSESKSAKDDDTSSTKSSVDDRWKGYTMWRISNASKALCGGHWIISCSMYDADGYFSRRFCRKQEFYQECIKNSKCLELLKDYAIQHQEVLYFYNEIEKDVINATTDDNSSSSSGSSSSSSLSVSSSAKKGDVFLIKNVKLKKSSSPD
eukprot:5814873-Ditylum_brightwellii.AAC.1